MIRLKTRIGSKYQPGDIIADDALDATLAERLIAEGRAERVRLSDQTALKLRVACMNVAAAMRSSLTRFDRAVREASPQGLEEVLAEHGISDENVELALEAHREALAADAKADVSANAKQATPPKKAGKKNTKASGKPVVGKAKAKPASGKPTDSMRSGAEAARGTHNPEDAGSNPASAPKTPEGEAQTS